MNNIDELELYKKYKESAPRQKLINNYRVVLTYPLFYPTFCGSF